MGAHLDKAQHLFDLHRFDLAEKELRAELANDPDHAGVHTLLGICLLQMGRVKEAFDAANEAVKCAPEYALAHYVVSRVYARLEQWPQAEAAITEAVRLEPESADFLGNLAFIYLSQGRSQKAMRAANEGMRIDPHHIPCINYFAMALHALGRKDEARELLQNALPLDPENDQTHANLGRLLLAQDRRDGAVENLREALRLDPQDEESGKLLRRALKERLLIRLVIVPHALPFLVLLGAAIMQNRLEGSDRLIPLLLPIAVVTAPFVVFLERASMPRLLAMDQFCQLPAFSALRLVAEWTVGGLLSLGATLAGWWLDWPGLVGVGMIGYVAVAIARWRTLASVPAASRPWCGVYLSLVAGIGMVGSIWAIHGAVPGSAVGFFCLAFHLVGAFYAGFFARVLAPAE